MFKRILVPTDGSRAALRAVYAVAMLAASAGGISVTLVIAIAPLAPEKTDLDERLVARQNESMRCHAEQVLESTSAILAEYGIPHSTKVLEGNPTSEAILREAEAENYDLIAMSSVGMGMSKNDWHYVGSVTEKVIRGSTVPVLVVPIHTGA